MHLILKSSAANVLRLRFEKIGAQQNVYKNKLTIKLKYIYAVTVALYNIDIIEI